MDKRNVLKKYSELYPSYQTRKKKINESIFKTRDNKKNKKINLRKAKKKLKTK